MDGDAGSRAGKVKPINGEAMDFQLTPSQQMTRRAMREFVRKEVAPLAPQWDEKDEFPLAVYKQTLALEVLELTVPASLDGGGGDFLSFVISLEEFARGSAALAYSIAATEAAVDFLSRHGSKPQQDQYLTPLRAGEVFGAAAICGPVAQNDPGAAVHAAAVEDGYRLNGTLEYVPFASLADLTLGFAAAENDRRYAFVLDNKLTGVETAETEPLMGLRGFPLGRVQLKDVQLSKDHLLGGTAAGQKSFDEWLMRSEAAAGAIAVGLSQAALEAAVRHSKARVQFGRTLADMEATRNKIADMAAGIQSARLLVYEASFSLDRAKQSTPKTAMAKLIASKTAVGVCREALQIHGGYGYVKDYLVERLYRDALFTTVYPSGNAVQRRAVAQQACRQIR